jgi:hypothetical protein
LMNCNVPHLWPHSFKRGSFLVSICGHESLVCNRDIVEMPEVAWIRKGYEKVFVASWKSCLQRDWQRLFDILGHKRLPLWYRYDTTASIDWVQFPKKFSHKSLTHLGA